MKSSTATPANPPVPTKPNRLRLSSPTTEGKECHFGIRGVFGLVCDLILHRLGVWCEAGEMTTAKVGRAGSVPPRRIDEWDTAFMQSVAKRKLGRRLALDVGTREGHSSQPYAQVGWRVVSLDIAIQGLRSGLRSGRIQHGRAVVADGRRLPFRDAAFGLVSSRWFLHENPDQRAFLCEMKRVVRDQGGIVAIDFAAPDRASQAYLNRHILPNEHVRTRGEFAEPWRDAGLALKRIEWRVRRLQRNAEVRRVACGPEGHVPQEVRRVLHITCDDSGLSLDIPVACLVAREIASQ